MFYLNTCIYKELLHVVLNMILLLTHTAFLCLGSAARLETSQYVDITPH